MSNDKGSDRPASRRRAGTVRVWDEVAQPNRRAFLRLAAVQGASVPAAYFMLGGQGAAASSGSAEGAATDATVRRKGAIRADREVGPKAGTIVRDFCNPRIEMIRLLREAAEVEHALMIQYLYAALSVKPAYHNLVGYGEPNTTDFLGVAVQEMQHLAAVNKLLVELGSPPHLERQDFPYEPDIYPFEFNLMPLSKRCSAMFMFTEAPAEALDRTMAATPAAHGFIDSVDATLGLGRKPNHVGSFYRVVIDRLEEVIATAGNAPRPLPDLKPWVPAMGKIMAEGEKGHFVFFKELFTGVHAGFSGHPDIWRLAPADPAYPAWQVAVTPSA